MQIGSLNNGNRHDIGWFKAVGLVISWLIIVSLAKDVWQIRTGFGRITESEARLVNEEARNNNLKQKLKEVMTEGYREKLIREKLNMQKEGEIIVVMPKRGELRSDISPAEQAPEHVWEKWWKLLRG